MPVGCHFWGCKALLFRIVSDAISSELALPFTGQPDFPSVLWDCWLGDRKVIRPVKNWVLVCWWWHFDWSFFSSLVAPVVTTTSITLSSNKIQNGDIPVPAYRGPPGKWPLKRRERTDTSALRLFAHVLASVDINMNSLRWLLAQLSC